MLAITIRIQTNYGREYYYPVCEKAKIFAALVRKTTLTSEDLQHIKRLGFTIEVETQTVAL